LQGVAPKYLARGWPGLWKNAWPLTTWIPVILLILYSLAQNSFRPNGASSSTSKCPHAK
jgi:hypothetical protein